MPLSTGLEPAERIAAFGVAMKEAVVEISSQAGSDNSVQESCRKVRDTLVRMQSLFELAEMDNERLRVAMKLFREACEDL
jgi:hypothetical protein